MTTVKVLISFCPFRKENVKKNLAWKNGGWYWDAKSLWIDFKNQHCRSRFSSENSIVEKKHAILQLLSKYTEKTFYNSQKESTMNWGFHFSSDHVSKGIKPILGSWPSEELLKKY